jgi:hypothetical protein
MEILTPMVLVLLTPDRLAGHQDCTNDHRMSVGTTSNVHIMLCHVHVTTVAVEMQKSTVFFPHYLINGMLFGENVLKIKDLFGFSL